MSSDNGLKTLSSSQQYTIGWIAALAHERAAALMMLDERHNKPRGFSKNRNDPNSYSWGRVADHNIVIASLPEGEYGIVSAADTAHGLQASLSHIRIGLMVGIGAGVPDKDNILLGDVVVSKPGQTNGGVVQYDLYKAKREITAQQTQGTVSVNERKGFLDSPPKSLRHGLGALRAEHEMSGSKIQRYVGVFQTNENTRGPYGFPGADKDPLRKSKASPRLAPAIHYGTIASGNALMKDAVERDQLLKWLKEDNITPLCLEMEAAGLMNTFPCLVIRGICDYADEFKDDLWQRYAAATAAAFAKELLEVLDNEEVFESASLSQALEGAQMGPDSAKQEVLLNEATYRLLLVQMSIIEGRNPPERFADKIERGMELGTWEETEDGLNQVLNHVPFDPTSAKHKGDYLFAACYIGDEENVRRGLAAGADINHTYQPFTMVNPLHAAVTFDHFKIIELLLKAGASLSQTVAVHGIDEQTYMQEHLQLLSQETLRLLLDHYGKDILPSNALVTAAAYSEPAVLVLLLERGFDLNAKLKSFESPAQAAVRFDQPANLEVLINAGYDLDTKDKSGRTILFDAVVRQLFDIVNLLLDHVTNPAVQDNKGNTIVHALIAEPQAANGSPVINDAITQAKIEILQVLCARQMPLDRRNLSDAGQAAPLHLAITSGQWELAEILLDAGADCNLIDVNGWSPLHLCANLGGDAGTYIAALLISKGASLKARIRYTNKYTPYDIARARAHSELAKMLKEAAIDRGIRKWMARR